MPKELQNVPSLRVENRNVEDIYHDQKGRVCLLDPAAMQELGPDDGDKFDVFLFGGILGKSMKVDGSPGLIYLRR